MNKLTEGQTQVYSTGYVVPQRGVDTSAAYLNTPPQQLIDITKEFFKSGKSEAQVLAILVGMGTKQQLALSAIKACKSMGTMIENKQKNHNSMKFTLVDLYEKVVNAIEKLDEMSADKSRTSYSNVQAKQMLESALKMFPEMTINDNIIAKLTTEELEKIKEGENAKEIWLTLVDEKVTPVLKFNIAKEIHKASTIHDWMKPISELKNYLNEMYRTNALSFKVNEAVRVIGNRNNPLDARLAGDLTDLLRESEDYVKDNFEVVALKNPWSSECKVILNEMKAAEKGADQGKAKIIRTLTPMIAEGEKISFHLHGKNYQFDGKEVSEAEVKDPRFEQVLEGLGLFKEVNNKLMMFGESDSILSIDLNEGTIMLGDVDLSEKETLQIKEALIANKFFSFQDTWKADKVCSLIEHLDMVAEMDNALSLTSTEFLNVYLTMLTVEGGVWVNKVNPAMKLNEMKFFSTATEALKEAKEFIGYDATSYLSESLIKEGQEEAIRQEKRTIVEGEITFLETEKKKIEDAIGRLGESEELTEALKLVNAELIKKEQELQSTYVVEKKSKREYLDDGYTEATMAVSAGPFKKGQEVMVNAEEYSSLGDDDLIDVVDANTMKSEYIERGKLKVKI